ncbi:MAG: sigma-70 family RNA polymerase sigma factor [Planctomycetota bacterium]
MEEALDDLLLRASRGETPAVDVLLDRYLPGLRAWVRLKAGGALLRKESSSDIVQSVCRDVLENLDRFRFDGEVGFRKWLYRTAQRKIADRYEYYKAQKRDIGREESVAAAYGADASVAEAELLQAYHTICTPSRHAMGREEIARIEGAFDALDEDQRKVVLMAKVLGMTRAEIGAELGKSEGAVRTMLYRAMARLSELLDA